MKLIALSLTSAAVLATVASGSPADEVIQRHVQVIHADIRNDAHKAYAQQVADAQAPKPATAPKAESKKEVIVRRFDRKPMEMEKVTFLGVETAPVSPTLVAQLALPSNAGLVVVNVVPNSSASGVLQSHDILLRLDDQILIDQHQLSVLVRNHKEGDEVTLTYMRAGKQGTARVKLATHEVPKVSDVLRRALPLHVAPGAGAQVYVRQGDREDLDRVLSMIQGAHGNEPVRMRIEGGGPGLRGVSVNTAKSNLVFSDDKGSLELTMNGEEKTLIAKSPKGEQQFSGPVSTPEQRNALPTDLRERLEKLESMQDVTFRTDGDFQGAETRVFRPGADPIVFRRLEQPAPRAPLQHEM